MFGFNFFELVEIVEPLCAKPGQKCICNVTAFKIIIIIIIIINDEFSVNCPYARTGA